MKKTFALLTIVALFLFSNEASAQQLTPPQQQTLNKLFKNKKVVYFKFNVRSMQEIPQFGKIFSVDKNKGMEVSAHATKDQFEKFLRMNLKYTVIPPAPVKKKAATKKTVPKK
ncbi:MAG TPA: hypothetical protein VGC65_03140 [Bacteroidia bacterium]|jgi:hypothetical protein